jgi:hypothetical protein
MRSPFFPERFLTQRVSLTRKRLEKCDPATPVDKGCGRWALL